MNDSVFWILWFATLLVCLWQLCRAFLSPYRVLEWPFLASAMWLYFYVYMAFQAKRFLTDLLPDETSVFGQLMPLLSLLGILAGWHVGKRVQPQAPTIYEYPATKVWVAGIVCLMIGVVGAYSVMITAAGAGIDYASSSAYWYLLFYVGYPGFAAALWAVYKMSGTSRVFAAFLLIICVSVFLAPNVMNARRGPVFPAAVILLLVSPLALKRRPKPVVIGAGFAAIALLMLLFVSARQFTYNGGTWSDAMENVLVVDEVVQRGQKETDNEYINNCHLITTLWRNGKYQYGTGHFSLLVHWIPRAWWSTKPALGEGLYPTEEIFDDVETEMGIKLLGAGAASGGVAETFIQYGAFCPLFWALISWVAARIFVLATLADQPQWQLSYVCFIAATHWLVSQGFAAALVPGLFFQAVLFAILFCTRRTETASEPASAALRA
jgi:hypothetical protein